MSDATVLTRYCFFFLLLFLLHVFLSYVWSLICEAVLCLELVFAELGQAHYNFLLLLLLLLLLEPRTNVYQCSNPLHDFWGKKQLAGKTHLLSHISPFRN